MLPIPSWWIFPCSQRDAGPRIDALWVYGKPNSASRGNYLLVVARSASDEAIQNLFCAFMDCFSLTASQCYRVAERLNFFNVLFPTSGIQYSKESPCGQCRRGDGCFVKAGESAWCQSDGEVLARFLPLNDNPLGRPIGRPFFMVLPGGEVVIFPEPLPAYP